MTFFFDNYFLLLSWGMCMVGLACVICRATYITWVGYRTHKMSDDLLYTYSIEELCLLKEYLLASSYSSFYVQEKRFYHTGELWSNFIQPDYKEGWVWAPLDNTAYLRIPLEGAKELNQLLKRPIEDMPLLMHCKEQPSDSLDVYECMVLWRLEIGK